MVGMRKCCTVIAVLAVLLQVLFKLVVTYYDELFVYGGRWCAYLLPEFQKHEPPQKLDYTDDSLSAWVGHPLKEDMTDRVPPGSPEWVKDNQADAPVDAFFLYPTGYFGFRWNAPASQDMLSDWIADHTLMVHASVLNGVAKVYAPLYRQMGGFSFLADLSEEKTLADHTAAMDLAYEDVKDAFQVFLDKWNGERPIVLKGHSQGSKHLARLLREYFKPGSKLREKLVAAYLIGSDLHHGDIADLPVCQAPEDTSCVVGYNVFIKGGDTSKFILSDTPKDLVCVNPLTWTATSELVNKSKNIGSRPVYPQLTVTSFDPFVIVGDLKEGLFEAQCRDGVVWTNEPPVDGFITGIFPGRNYHGVETSMFWLNTRQNIELRVKEYFRKLKR